MCHYPLSWCYDSFKVGHLIFANVFHMLFHSMFNIAFFLRTFGTKHQLWFLVKKISFQNCLYAINFRLITMLFKVLRGRKQFQTSCVILKWLILLLIKSRTINLKLKKWCFIIIKMVYHYVRYFLFCPGHT